MSKPLSPKKYIISKAAQLPLHECLINDQWNESGLATIIICKKMPSGNYTVALFLVDIFCLGLKNTLYQFNLSELEYGEFLDKACSKEDFLECNLETAHNIIFGAIDYAEELGFKPNQDFKITEYFLDPDLITDEIDEIEFGKDGKPFFINGPNDNIPKVLATLNKVVGKGNYEVLNEGASY